MFNRVTGWINSIEDLGDNGIFVFGSNLSGRHGKGAALFAKRKLGAKYGVAEGLTGRSYALPTVNKNITASLSLNKIKCYIYNFIKFAKEHKEYDFYVTEIGCGLAGYSVNQIAPLFIDSYYIDNIALPQSFWNIINAEMNDLFKKIDNR